MSQRYARQVSSAGFVDEKSRYSTDEGLDAVCRSTLTCFPCTG
jgi:hypothetical protein